MLDDYTKVYMYIQVNLNVLKIDQTPRPRLLASICTRSSTLVNEVIIYMYMYAAHIARMSDLKYTINSIRLG